ncbi:uncharacterized protein LOC100677987 [Nasonia vitripennis]|uniref:Uncharacterized protein n=1 Tax=Nasonia vitripennis TaxID=7425 RepID=A0A7M7LSC5_NASVI|nr:uncharacterized protein LOC100677987 [Nasonia vitripennis]XP_016840974.1 uncharacterized protein LOC100677987 [Nasonia vitripennis]
MEAEDSKQVDICTNEAPDSRSKDYQAESDGESDTSPLMDVPDFVAAELPTKANVSESNNPTDKMISKSRVKSLTNVDVESLDAPVDVKDILRNAKAQIISLQRKNKTLQTKLYRWKKGVKTGNSLLSHLKHRKYINENVVDSLKVSKLLSNS